MLSKKMQDALNDQINAEFGAFYTYLSMSAYFEAENLPGFAAWMHSHASEEQMHAMKIYDFVNERGGRVELKTLDGPKTTWTSAQEAFEDALDHEKKVTKMIDNLVNLAIEESDHATNSFLQWFVDEQVEEEDIVDNVLQDLKRVGDSQLAIFMLDRELGTSNQVTGGAEAQ